MASLVIRQVPRTSSRVLSNNAVRNVVTNVLVVQLTVPLYLGRREMLAPEPTNAAEEVVEVPIIRIVAPFSNGMILL